MTSSDKNAFAKQICKMLKESNRNLFVKIIDFIGKEVTLKVYKHVYNAQ